MSLARAQMKQEGRRGLQRSGSWVSLTYGALSLWNDSSFPSGPSVVGDFGQTKQ